MTTLWLPHDSAALALGADALAEALTQAARESGVELTLVRTGSRGMHWLEPMLEFEQGGIRHGLGPLSAEDGAAVIAALQAGTLEGLQQHLGAVDALPWMQAQQRLSFARVGVIDPVDVADYCQHGGYTGLDKALAMAPQAIVDSVKESGLRGRGGAAFPTGIKWQTVLDAKPTEQRWGAKKYIVCNADEGDSGTFADRMLMEGDPLSLIEGMTIAGLAVGAVQGYIYLRSEYPQAAHVTQAAIDAAYADGYLGESIRGSDKQFDLELRIGAGAYICGEETSLLDSLEGKRGMVRAKPPLPALEGLFGQPTVVNNVISLASVPVILAKGGDHYQAFGEGRSRGTLPIQLAGNVRCGGLLEMPFGITLRELLDVYCEGTASGRPARAIQVGGPLGAYLPESQWDTKLDYEAFAAIKAMLGHGGIVVFDDQVDMAEQAEFAMEFCAIESCGKCTPCRVGAVRGKETIQKIRRGEDADNNMLLLDDLCNTMVAGSLCAMGGLTPFPVRSAVAHFPEDFGAAQPIDVLEL